MIVFLVHHAEAVGPDVDTRRPLSARGRLHATALAENAKARGAAPSRIWHSGKFRSRETAEAFWRVCNPLADFRVVRGLRPEDPAEWIRDLLAAESDDVLLVGHMPFMPAIAHLLTGRCEAFPLHGMMAVRRDEGVYSELWRIAE